MNDARRDRSGPWRPCHVVGDVVKSVGKVVWDDDIEDLFDDEFQILMDSCDVVNTAILNMMEV